jgi:endonuclease/exonuclease/phosphatase family metal-dependent hydrolase
MSSQVKVITYNLLSPKLCNQSDFLNYVNPEDLDPTIRKTRTIALLESFFAHSPQPIICLQEISADWKGTLELLFAKHDYSFFNISYGILGIGIAIPNQSISVINVEYIHIGELIKTNTPRLIWRAEEEYREAERDRKIREDNLTFMQKVSLYVKDMTALIPEYIRVIEETIEQAKWRKNYAIRLTLRLKLKLKTEEKEIIVYNYHMPCTFKKPIIQFLHLSVFKRLILQHHMIPTIFAGDFNITPYSDEYNFFTGEPVPESKTVYLPKEDQEDISYQSFKMTTIAQTTPFTCHSETKFGGYFNNTLDYIFVSNANITDSNSLLQTNEKMPNSVCPSDHLPIYSNISF